MPGRVLASLLLGALALQALAQQPGSCLNASPTSAAGVTLCPVEELGECLARPLYDAVLVAGSPGAAAWNFSQTGPLWTAGPNATAACLTVEGVDLRPVSLATLLDPPIFLWANGARRVALRDVELRLTCGLLLEWQALLCGARLPGFTYVSGPNIYIPQWYTKDAVLERVNLTCSPEREGIAFSPVCSMCVVEAVDDILEALNGLQDPSLPIMLVLRQALSFGNAFWPDEGVRITGNVTLSAIEGQSVVLDFGLKTVLFTVDSKSSANAFLAFRGCVLMNLPLSYLPIDHPRRPFGVLSTGLWPIYREQVAMGLYNCTLILTQEEFKFWSFWLSILISPIPAVRQLGNWSFATGVQVEPSGDDFIRLSSYYGRYTTLVDVRYEMSNAAYQTMQENSILQITGDAQVPPTVVFQVRDSQDLLSALAKSSTSDATQYGQYIVLSSNVSLANDTQWPPGGVPIRNPTTITTWPSTYVTLDLQLWRDVFATSARVTLKNAVFYNLVPGPEGSVYMGLTSGLWAFNVSNWNSTYQAKLYVENAALLVSPAEVTYYVATTIDWSGKGDRDWVRSFKVQSYDDTNGTWIFFAHISTLRFTAANVNITSHMPEVLDMLPIALPATPVVGGGVSLGADASSGGGNSKRDILLFATLAITLPTVIAAIVCTFIFMRRRRIRLLCAHDGGAAAAAKDAGLHGDDDDADAFDTAGPESLPSPGGKSAASRIAAAACCGFPLPLRRSKFVNPLFAAPDEQEAEVVLTEVLGRVGEGHTLSPVPPEGGDAGVGPGAAQPAALAGADGASGGDEERGAGAAAGAADFAAAAARGTRDARSAASLLPADSPSSSGAHALAAAGAAHALAAATRPGSGRHRSSASSSAAAAAAQDGAAGAGAGHLQRPLSGASSLARAEAASASCPASAPLPIPHAHAPGRSGRLGALSPRHGGSGSGAGASGADAHASAQLWGPWRSGGGTGHGDAGGDLERGDMSPRIAQMQRLEQMRRDIGDRHLEVHHSLGWGGCGVVYKGTWKGLPVAVKTVLVQANSPQSQRYLTEAAISASLQHVNIVTTYLYELRPLDEVVPGARGANEIQVEQLATASATPSSAGEALDAGAAAAHALALPEGPSGGSPSMSCWKLYIVQEYCELGTLKTAIDQGSFKGPRGGMPNMSFLLAVALDVVGGLLHVHGKGMVHGDVTVSNVLLQVAPARPQGCVAKLADFGMSIKLEGGRTEQSHLYGGTPHYMAPERMRGLLSQRSDVYSLGVCLWELYCGTPPWRRNTQHGRGRYGEGTDCSGFSVESCGGGGASDAAGAQYGGGGGGLAGGDSLRLPRSCPQEYAALVAACLASDPAQRPDCASIVDTLARLQRRYG